MDTLIGYISKRRELSAVSKFGFGSADENETIVFGAERPCRYLDKGIQRKDIADWIDYIRTKGIKRICCLLAEYHLNYYDFNLIEQYGSIFGDRNVCHAPIRAFSPCDLILLNKTILPFLSASAQSNQPVVVHCSSGSVRTGLVLAAWLTYKRGYTPGGALEAVMRQGLGRNPKEVVESGLITDKKLVEVLKSVTG